jgi:hypothetical protein
MHSTSWQFPQSYLYRGTALWSAALFRRFGFLFYFFCFAKDAASAEKQKRR